MTEAISVHLERAGISEYAEAFDDAGYDDFDFLSDLGEDDLRAELSEGVEGLPAQAVEKFMAYVASTKKAKEEEPKLPSLDDLPPALTDDEVREKLKRVPAIEVKNMSTLFSSLHLDMSVCKGFEEEGYDDPQILKECPESDLDEVAAATNMKPGHILRLKCWLQGLIVCVSETEYVVVHRYSGEYYKSTLEDILSG